MADTPMQHPVTGAWAMVASKDVKQYEEGGWVDTTPYDPKAAAKAAAKSKPSDDES